MARPLLIACAAAAAGRPAAGAVAPAFPAVPDTWTATVRASAAYGGNGDGWGAGTYSQSGADYKLTVHPPERWVGPTAAQTIAVSANLTTQMASSGSVCSGFPRLPAWDPRNWYEYAGSLTWLQRPETKGIHPVYASRGIPKEWGANETQDCDLWVAKLTDGASSVYACIGDDGLPRAAGFKAGPIVGASNMGFWSHVLFYENITVGGVKKVEMLSCPPRVICRSTGFDTLDVWFQTGFAPSNLTDKNGGDIIGSLVFAAPNSTREYVKRYTVQVSTDYGPWGNCNYVGGHNVCELDMPPHVGRCGSNQLGGSQCGPITDIGVWYSFPFAGLCGEGEAVGTRGCTWKAKLEKMVTGICVKEYNDHAFLKAWGKDIGKAPFPNVQAALLAAYEGCPNVTAAAEDVAKEAQQHEIIMI